MKMGVRRSKRLCLFNKNLDFVTFSWEIKTTNIIEKVEIEFEVQEVAETTNLQSYKRTNLVDSRKAEKSDNIGIGGFVLFQDRLFCNEDWLFCLVITTHHDHSMYKVQNNQSEIILKSPLLNEIRSDS